MAGALVTGLWSHPVKSLRPNAHVRARFGQRGLLGDRRLMVVDGDGVFITQRHVPEMARVDARLEGDMLTLAREGLEELPVQVSGEHGARREVRVWNHGCSAVDQGDEAAAWLDRALGREGSRLVCMPDDHVRPVDPAKALHADDQVGFADGAPFLVCTEASLADLNSRMAAPLPIDRFRPNLMLGGVGEPWAEDNWQHVRIGQAEFDVLGACTRCAITTTDQQTGERGREPLATLATFRRTDAGKVTFGVYLVPREPTGELAVGDAFEVLR